MTSHLRILTRPWVLAFVAFFALSAAWAVASPLTASPDEPAHMVRAAAVVRGELYGTEGPHLTNGLSATDETLFRLPATFNGLQYLPVCYAGKPETPAGCSPELAVGSQTVSVPSSAGGYNPLYYAIVGLPSLVAPNTFGIYLMRLFSAALCSALLASALLTALERRRPTWSAIGVAVAATPMVLFLNGMVNPNALEDSSAILAWTSLLALTTDPSPELTGRRLRRAAVACLFLANARELGPLWILAIVTCMAFVGEWRVIRGLLRDRRVWWTGGVAVASCMAAELWAMSAAPSTPVPPVLPNGTLDQGLHFGFYSTGSYIQEMIGAFGWLDTKIPPGTEIGWYAAIGFLVLLAVSVGRRRDMVALAAITAAIVVLPVLAIGFEFKEFGYGWQGRYSLAIAVGLPILAGAVAGRSEWKLEAWVERRIAWTLTSVLALAGIAAFLWSEIRYAAGAGHSILPPLHPKWSPPLTWFGVWVVYLGGAFALYRLVILAEPIRDRLLGTAAETPVEEPEGARDELDVGADAVV